MGDPIQSYETSPFVKQLAANDRPTRDKALSSLRTYLSSRHHSANLSHLDLLKLWKGLFYTLWFSDRPKTQQRLCSDLAQLSTSCFDGNLVAFINWYRAFWETICREWSGLDALRLDKFLLCVRRFVGEGLAYLERDGRRKKMQRSSKSKESERGREKGDGEVDNDDGDDEIVDQWVRILEEVPLHPTNSKMPNGLRYHLIDIYVDELEKLYESLPSTLEAFPLPLAILLRPFEKLVAESHTKLVRIRASQLLSDERLQQWGYESANAKRKTQGDEDEDEWTGMVD